MQDKPKVHMLSTSICMSIVQTKNNVAPLCLNTIWHYLRQHTKVHTSNLINYSLI